LEFESKARGRGDEKQGEKISPRTTRIDAGSNALKAPRVVPRAAANFVPGLCVFRDYFLNVRI
jgi:hypothetical protein